MSTDVVHKNEECITLQNILLQYNIFSLFQTTAEERVLLHFLYSKDDIKDFSDTKTTFKKYHVNSNPHGFTFCTRHNST